MKPGLIIAVIITASQLLLPAAAQGVAYQWVDAEGVTHFSDKPPASGQTAQGNVASIDLPAEPAAANPAEDYYSIANQWKRLHKERLDNRKLALQQERLSLQQAREERAQQSAAAALPPPASAPVVFFGGAARYPGAPYGGRVYRGMQSIYHHGPIRRDYYRGRDNTSHAYAPAHFQLGGSASGYRGSGPVNQCCRSINQ